MAALVSTLVALLVIAAGTARAADTPGALSGYNVVSWTSADGLPSSNIFSLTQDLDGYLWLGTDEGVVRFDGFRFVNWNALGGTHLPERRVLSVLCAADGSLWIAFGGAGGISRIRDRRVTNYGERDGVPHDFVRGLLQDHRGTLWAISPSGLYTFDGTRWNRVGKSSGIPDGPTWNAYEDRSGSVWVIAATGVFRQDQGAHTFRPVHVTAQRMRDLAEDASGAVLVTDPVAGVVRLDDAGGASAFLTPGLRGDGARLRRDRTGTLWVGTLGQGLWRVAAGVPGDPPVQVISTRSGLSSDEIRAIMEDREGNVWVGTAAGLHRLSPRIVTEVTGLGLSRAVVVTRDGTRWFGTASGLFRQSGSGRRLEPMLALSVFGLHADPHGDLWIGTDRGLYRFAHGRISAVPLPHGASLRQIVAIATDAHGTFWLCDQERGVFRWRDDGLTMVWPRPDMIRRTPYGVIVGADGRVWMALSGGTLGMITPDGSVRLFGSQGDGSFRAVVESRRDHALWIAGDDGLSRFSDGRFVTAGRNQGLPSNAVTAVVEDASGRIWAGVGAGIVRVDPREFAELEKKPGHQVRYTLYDRSDGLTGAPEWLATPSSTLGPDGTLWFVIGNGMAMLDPTALTHTHVEPRAQIDTAMADAQVLDIPRHAVLPPFTRLLQIEYTAVSFVSPMRVRFRYRLEGFDRDWVEAGSRRQAFYTNLPPRQYRFRVTAATSEGKWIESSTAWDFSIAPAFYQTTWFPVLAVVIALVLLWVFWQLHLRQVRRRFALVLAERARVSRELHDTLLQSLVGVALQFEGLSHRADAASASLREHLLRMGAQVEDHIREARQSIGALRAPACGGRGLVDELQETARRITADCPAAMEFEVEGTPRRYGRDTEEQLVRIGREALSNAVRHSSAAHIRLELHFGSRSFHLRVKDDGVGFDGRPVDGHYGLVNMDERAELIGGRFSITTALGRGTQIDVVVPISWREWLRGRD